MKEKSHRTVSKFLCDHKCPSTKGFYYLKGCLERLLGDPAMMASMTKLLYEQVANEFETDAGNVEKCLRVLINLWWENGLDDSGMFSKKPTNKECIIRLAEAVMVGFDGSMPRQSERCSCQIDTDDGCVSIYEKLFG